jgi:phospho-N-acetylmuramoyl-pentapeptide-transferase
VFKELFFPLVKYFTPFNIFQYITFRAAYAAITALLVLIFVGPRIIRALRRKKMGEGIREDGPQSHFSKAGTPTMGGILIIIATLIAVVLWQDLQNLKSWVGILAIVGFGLVGFIDDYIKVFKKNKQGLSSKSKLIGQLIVGTAICLILYWSGGAEQTKLYIPMIRRAVLDLGVLWVPLGILFLTFFSNAVNLTDGLDGLATGLMIMVALALALISYLSGHVNFAHYLGINFVKDGGEIAVLCLALVGACVGFLWYNSNPAEVFMGDTGSLMLGGTLGTIALMMKKEVLLLIVGGVFVMEALSVIIQVLSYKFRNKKRVFLMAPLHHHFELKGWPENKVVLRFWILGGMCAILALSTLKLQ